MNIKIIKNILSTAFVFLSVTASSFVTAKSISQEKLQDMMKEQQNFILLDVRTESEFNAGHIPSAENIPHSSLPLKYTALGADKNTKIVIYCRSGKRAEIARQTLIKNGFKNLDHLNGDFNAWSGNNLPIVKEEQ